MTFCPQRLLLVCPKFFGYHEALLQAAETQGFSSSWINARASESMFYKAGLKFAPRLVRDLYRASVERAISGIQDIKTLTHIVIVKGDGLPPDVLRALRVRAVNARTILYFWDSIRNAPGAQDLVDLCDTVVTFDAKDARKKGWRHLPLFSRTPMILPRDKSNATYDWCFVGSVHGDRHAVLERLALAHPELNRFVRCYVPSELVRLGRAIRDPGLLSARHVPVTTDLLSKEDYLAAIINSKAVVDIEHPSQTGLTMRTIETLLSGTKLITTNEAVRDLDLFHPSRVHVIDRSSPQIALDFLAMPFLPIPPETGKKYQVKEWFSSLVEPEVSGRLGRG